jgi:hypothetical protein
VGPGEAEFIDDVPGYVEAAEKLGMSGIILESPAQLESALASLQLLG